VVTMGENTGETTAPRGLSALQEDPSLGEREGVPPDSGPEKRVMKLRRAMFRAAPVRFAVLALAVPAGLIAAGWLMWGREQAVAWGAGVCAVASVAALGWLVVWWVACQGHTLEVTNKRTIRRIGLLSKDTSEVLHDNIRNFQVHQRLWERLWKVGSIGISCSGQDGIEITMDKVPNPGEVRRVIDLYRPLG